MRTTAETQELIRTRSTLTAEQTEAIIAKRFRALPRRLLFAMQRWPLDRASVLDVGCSYGHCLLHFGPGSLGIDNVPEYVAFCRAIGLEAQLVDADRGLDAVPDAAFDYIWVSDVLEHLDAPRLLLRTLSAKLRPDGRLILYTTALPRSRVVRLSLRRTGRNRFDSGAHHYQFTYETLRYLLERTGYRVEAVEVPPLKPRLRPLAAFFRFAAPALFFEAAPDPEAERLARTAEQRNKPSELASTVVADDGFHTTA